MKLTIKRLAAMLLAMTMMLSGAVAEGVDLSTTQPLLDLTVAAALQAGDTPETITAEGALSEAFVKTFFFLGQSADASLGITKKMLTSASAQEDYIARAFASGRGETGKVNQQHLKVQYDYVGVRVMSAELLDGGQSVQIVGDVYQAAGPLMTLTEAQFADMRWLDRRVVAIMRRDEAAPGGWLVESCSLDGQMEMENQAQTYFAQTMVEYVNVEHGFSLQYPAVFLSAELKEEATGVSASLSDGTASFFARKMANTQGWTLEKIIAARQQENPAAEANINDISGCGRVVTRRSDGYTVADIYIVTDQWVYQAQLAYAGSLAADFSLYSDYMMNSFNADELGMG